MTQESYERILLPWFVKERLVKTLLRDIHHYLFNVQYSPRPGASYCWSRSARREQAPSRASNSCTWLVMLADRQPKTLTERHQEGLAQAD